MSAAPAVAAPSVDISAKLDQARAYLAAGCRVGLLYYPDPVTGRCSCGGDCGKNAAKHPHTGVMGGGLTRFTRDISTFERWLMQEPNANLAIEAPVGYVFIDIDDVAAMQADGRTWPATLQERTGRGGLHLLLRSRVVGIVNSVKLLPYLDVRGPGSYIVTTPSVHILGVTYGPWDAAFDLVSVADAPEWIEELLAEMATEVKMAETAAPTFTWRRDAEVPAKLEALLEGDQRARLTWQGQRADLPSPSEYDMALANTFVRAAWSDQEIADALTARRREWGHELKRAAYYATTIKTARRPRTGKATGEDAATQTTGYLRTDGGNAERFARDHAGKVRYCGAWGRFLRWDDTRWQANDDGAVERLAKATVRFMLAEAVALPDGDADRKRAIYWAVQSDSRARREAMLALAKSETGIPVRPADLDAQPYLLNVANGVLDLRDGRLLPHDPGLLLTKLAPVEYHPEAGAPLFDAYLERVLPDELVRRFVQRFLGYCLTAYVSEQVLLFLWGVGANGKTTLVNIVMYILGGYAKQAAPDLLMQRAGDHHPTELADLLGARFVPTVEVQEGRRLAEVLVKQLSGGDRLKARYMRQDFWEFDPTHKLVLVANHKPVVRGTDYAIWRRILMVPFNVTIPPADRDPRLPEKLKDEAPGILRWLVEGCLAWQRGGLRPPASVVAATGDYQHEMDALGAWIDENCIESFDAWAWSDDLYLDYSRWSDGAGERPLRKVDFGGRLTERGFTAVKGARGRRRWLGIGLVDRSGGTGGTGGEDSGITANSKSRVVVMPKVAPPTPPTPPGRDREPGDDDEELPGGAS